MIKLSKFMLIRVGLVVLGLVWVIFHVFIREVKVSESHKKVIRFAHWSLESGVREALDEVAREYMRLHPEVEVIQQPIPSKVYSSWLTTQLIGETAPDLLLISKTMQPDRIARSFVPISSYVAQPNPYNRGTELESTPWAETFVDGLEGAYEHALQEYYGVPYGLHVIRVFFNKQLLEKTTGRSAPPADYESFMAMCRQIQDYSSREGLSIVPIAGSKFNTTEILPRFLANQTQKMIYNPSSLYTLTCDWANLAPAYWRGEWSLRTPNVKSGLEVMREIGQKMPPGFQQMEREDATFSFVQQRAVMIASGTWDRNSLKQETSGIFEIGACPIPIPTPSGQGIGQYVLGPVSEADNKGSSRLAIPRFSKKIEVALDFQRFLTSKRGNEIFIQRSGWLPIISGVEIPKELEAFRPQMEGYPKEFRLDWPGLGVSETSRLLDGELSQLFRHDSSVEKFTERIEKRYQEAILKDYFSNLKNQKKSALRMETILESQRQIAMRSGGEKERKKMLVSSELLNDSEIAAARSRYLMQAMGVSTKP